MNHPLDKPIWSALTSRQARFALGGALAKRFPADVSPFAGAQDASPDAVGELAALVPDQDDISLLECAPPAAPAGILVTLRPGVQMVAKSLGATATREQPIVPLSDVDAAEMLALATLTRPGPFRQRTHAMGRFIGIRAGTRLVAMCGERLATDEFIEVTALCTHPDYRRRGYAEALLLAASQRILDEGAIPFLHTYADNSNAIALYTRLGFELRTSVVHAVWQRERPIAAA